MPAYSVLWAWLKANPDFEAAYAEARRVGCQRLADELVEIADEGINDTYVDANGNRRTDHDVVNRSRLRVDTRKWLLSKMLPKVYGDRVALDHAGSIGVARELSDDALAAIATGGGSGIVAPETDTD